MAHQVALEQLQLGLDVIVECVNPVALTRDAWLGTSSKVVAGLVEVEIVCSDEAEHRHRVERRATDVDGLTKPTWNEVVTREYEPWSRPLLVIDSATTPVLQAAQRIASEVRTVRAGPAATIG